MKSSCREPQVHVLDQFPELYLLFNLGEVSKPKGGHPDHWDLVPFTAIRLALRLGTLWPTGRYGCVPAIGVVACLAAADRAVAQNISQEVGRRGSLSSPLACVSFLLLLDFQEIHFVDEVTGAEKIVTSPPSPTIL